MTTFPVTSIADLDGRKIGAPGPAVNWLKGTGAVGVSGNLTTYYNEIKTGVYDGVIVFASAALPGKLHEVAPYITKVGFRGAICRRVGRQHADWYRRSRRPRSRPHLKAAAKADAEAYQKDLDASVEKFLGIMQSQGATVTDVDQAFRVEWATGMDNVAKLWAEKLDSEGKAGSAVLQGLHGHDARCRGHTGAQLGSGVTRECRRPGAAEPGWRCADPDPWPRHGSR